MNVKIAGGCLAAACLVAGCGSSSSSSASSSGPIKIGASMAVTGPYANPSFVDGLKKAASDINAQGGITVAGKKRKVQLVILDDQSDNNTMIAQIRELAFKDDVSAELGPPSPQGQAATAIINAVKVPTVFYNILNDSVPSGAGGYWWTTSLSSQLQNEQEYQWFSTLKVKKTVAIISGNDPQSKIYIQSQQEAAKALGYDVVATASVATGGSEDFSSVINQAKSKGAAIVFTLLAPPDCIALLHQMKALGYTPQIFSAGLCGISPSFAKLGPLTNGATTATLWNPAATDYKPSATQMSSEFASEPNLLGKQDAVTAYEAMQVIANAITKAGSSSPAAINKAMAQTNATFALGPIKFAADHKDNLTTYQGQWKGSQVILTYPKSAASGTFVMPDPGLR